MKHVLAGFLLVMSRIWAEINTINNKGFNVIKLNLNFPNYKQS